MKGVMRGIGVMVNNMGRVDTYFKILVLKRAYGQTAEGYSGEIVIFIY
jgi:hypothetical protein